MLKKIKNPVMVMGMAQCGTTLLAEMVHNGGTPMHTGDVDPSYDSGIKCERPLCHAINRQILGFARDSKNPHSTEPLWTWPLQPFPQAELERLHAEVGDNAWGFKDPRTTHTYRVWLEIFPDGPRLYSYRSHREYLRRSLRTEEIFDRERARKRLEAWLIYNETIVANCLLDSAANRPWALVRYDDLMQNPELIRRLQTVTGIPLQDARNSALYRTRPASLRQLPSLRELRYILSAEAGQQKRLKKTYAALNALRLRT